MKITHFQKITLTIIIGVLAFWRVGIVVALLDSFFELPVAALSVNRALRVFANCRPVTGPCVFWIHAPRRVSVVLFLLPVGNGATDYCLLACVSNNEQRINRLYLCRACEVLW